MHEWKEIEQIMIVVRCDYKDALFPTIFCTLKCSSFIIIYYLEMYLLSNALFKLFN